MCHYSQWWNLDRSLLIKWEMFEEHFSPECSSVSSLAAPVAHQSSHSILPGTAWLSSSQNTSARRVASGGHECPRTGLHLLKRKFDVIKFFYLHKKKQTCSMDMPTQQEWWDGFRHSWFNFLWHTCDNTQSNNQFVSRNTVLG